MIVEDACRGIQYIHDRNHVHRDIKPANILLAENGRAKVSDFGLVAPLDALGVASAYGYITHLAPEVITDRVTTPRSDIYALGVTLYRLVNGDALLPSFSTTNELTGMITSGTFPDRTRYRPFVPSRLRQVINRAIAVEPEKRFSSADELRHALEPLSVRFDWSLDALANGDRWVGRNESHDSEVTLSGTRGSWEVYARVGRQGSALRKVNADSASGLNRAAAERQLARVLGRLTESGR